MDIARFRIATDLVWFASASFGAGLLAAIVAAAIVMLFAQPAYALTFRDADYVCRLDRSQQLVDPRTGDLLDVE